MAAATTTVVTDKMAGVIHRAIEEEPREVREKHEEGDPQCRLGQSIHVITEDAMQSIWSHFCNGTPVAERDRGHLPLLRINLHGRGVGRRHGHIAPPKRQGSSGRSSQAMGASTE